MKKLLVLSGKGGTGKTTVASAFCSLSKCKLAADCDVDAPNLHLILQQQTKPQEREFIGSKKAVIDTEKCIKCGKCRQLCRFNAVEEEEGKLFINEFKCEGCGVCELKCPVNAIHLEDDTAGKLQLYQGSRVFSTARLKMGRGNSGKLVSEVKESLFSAGKKDAELAVIDGSPGVGCPVMASISGVDLVLVVAEPSESGFSDMKRIVEVAERSGVKVAVCVNRVDTGSEKPEEIAEYCRKNGLYYVGSVPYDPMVPKAINMGKSIDRFDSPASAAVTKIYHEVIKILTDNQNKNEGDK